MAWQQQWANTATPTMVPALSGMSTVVNPAPAVLPPGAQYTADQWTQMQQQNWQQWAQWQQQYQQWHQQYGAQYQKSMTALSQTPTHTLPNTSLPPPLPQEAKPPLPPEEPPAQVLQPQQPTKGYTTVPPPQQANLPQQGNFTTAPPKQNVYSTPPSSQSPYNTQPPNKQSPYKTLPPSQQSYNTAHNSSFQGRNASGPTTHQNQKRNFGYNAPNWQPSTNERNFAANQNAPPSLLDLNIQKPDINQHGEKRPFVQTEDQDIKRNKVDEKLQSQSESPSLKSTVTYPQSDVDPREQLSETEKKFMKQFIEWEAQFNKWKDQNMNHPDKEQYREYEKKWEAWRTQLLERREQMRRKRLGLQGDSPVPDGKSVPIAKPGIKQPVSSEHVPVVSDVSKLPPTINTELVDINKPPPVIIDTSEEVKDDGSSFLKMTSSEGIPGLDLVKETTDENMIDDINAIDTRNENKGPDFDALSKGINNILGDQKLLSMLSLVTKNQTPQSSSTSIDTAPKVPESLQTESGDNIGNPSLEGANLLPQTDAMGNYDETRSSFAGPGDVNWNDSPRKGGDMNQENFNRFNQGDIQANFNNDANILKDNFNKRQPIFDMDYDPPNRYGRSDNIKNQDNFYGDNSFRRPDSFKDAAPDPNNENLRGPGNNNSFNNFRGPGNFGGPDTFRGPGSFKGRDNYAGPDKFMGSDASKPNFRKPDNFRGTDHFQENDNFRATDKFWESDNFRGSDSYSGPNKEYDNYGAEDEFEDCDNITSSDNFSAPSNFNKTDNFKASGKLMGSLRFEPPKKFEEADDNFRESNNSWRPDKFRGNDSFRGTDNFRGPGGFRGSDNINQPARGTNNFRGPNNLRESDTVGGSDSFRAPGNLRGSDNFTKPFDFNEPDNVKEPNNFRGSGEFRGPNDFKSFRGTGNFRGSNNSRGSGNFGGTKSFGGPDNFSDNDRMGGPGAPENFREYGNTRESNNFGGPDNYRTFGKFNRSGSFRESENNRTFQESDNFNEFGGSADNFNMGEQGFNSGNLKRGNRGNDNFNRGGNRKRSLSDWVADDSKEGDWYNENCDEERGNPNMEIDFSGGSQSLMKEADKFTQDAGHNIDEAENIETGTESKIEEQWGTEEHNKLSNVRAQVAMGEDPNAKEVNEVIWQPESVIDYEHKSQKPVEPDITLEPLKLFDYRHKPVNRIPFPHRPNWLSNMLRNCPEFDFMTSRPHDNQYNRYNKENRFTESRYDTRYSENKYQENKYPENKYAENKYPENKYAENKYPENKYQENKYSENKYPENKYPENKYSENKYDNRYNDRDKFESRRNLRNSTYKEEDESSNFQKRFDDYRPSFNRRPRDDIDYETIEFERKIDKRNVEDEDEGFPKRQCNVNLKDSNKHFKEQEKSITENKSRPSSKIALIEDILNPPGRFSRPARIVIILRGPPGSGKTFLAKLIKDKEVENGGSAPRILSLEDYFMVEQEKDVVEDGKKTKVKEMVYEYEECMEVSYRTSLLKAFKKTITDGYFPFIIVDNVNDKIKYFGEMWSFAKQNGFQVYICQLELDVQTCTKRNIHGRSEIEIQRLVAGWEPAPSHHSILDATGLVQSGSIPDVEMEEINSPTSDMGDESVEEQACRSKWDNFDCSIDNLAKLDGINKPLRPSKTMEDYLHCDDDWVSRESTKPGQKRVRWADLEERKEQEKMRAIGFVVGQTNWDRMMDPTMGSSALTQTKYIERASKFYRD